MTTAAHPLADSIQTATARITAPTPERLAELDRAAKERAEADAGRRQRDRIGVIEAKVGRRYAPSRVGFSRFEVYHPAQKEAVAKLQALTNRLDDPANIPGLVIYGTVGTGKDHLLATMLYHAASAGRACSWANGQEIFGAFRDAIDAKRAEAELLTEYTRPDVLGISDPIPPVVATSQPNAWRTELLFRVLDARYRDCKPTWITINAESPADADKKLSAPVFDRLQDGAEMVPCFWPSYRERKR